MAEKLTPCGECSRHVKASEAACPFCGAAMVAAPVPIVPFRRMAAAAAVASVAALAGCNSAPSVGVFYGYAGWEDAGDDGSSPAPVPFYGIASPPDASARRDAEADASSDGGAIADASKDGDTPADASGDSETADAPGDSESTADASSDANDGG
jgi:hypothetical protein